MWSSVALEDMTEAPMTIPGTLTSLEMVSELRSRIEVTWALEWRRSWWSGRLTLASCGWTIRWVHRFRADSNWSGSQIWVHGSIVEGGGYYQGDDIGGLVE
jgi:hypothetical protein